MNTLIYNNEKFKIARMFHNKRMVTAPLSNIMLLLEKINLKTVAITGNVCRVTSSKNMKTETMKQLDLNCVFYL